MLHVVRIAVLVVMVAATAEAQELAGTFEQLRVLVKSGETLTVTDTTGARIRGKLSQLSSSSLMLNVSGTDREFQSTQVDTIERRGPDSLKNGALIGFAIGGVLGGVAIATLTEATGDGGTAAAAALGGLIYGGMGAGVGAGVDALIEGQRVIYARSGSPRTVTIAPVLGRGRKGVLMTLRLPR